MGSLIKQSLRRYENFRILDRKPVVKDTLHRKANFSFRCKNPWFVNVIPSPENFASLFEYPRVFAAPI